MNVKINRVYSPGNIEKERVILGVLETVEISNYAIMDHTFTESGDLSDKGRHVYRFPKKSIKKGDVIILYTKTKPNGWVDEKLSDDKTYKIHFFYWGRKTTVWNKTGGDTCTLMEVHDTHVVKVNTD